MGSSSVASGVCGGNWVDCCKTVASASAGSEEAAGRRIIVASAAIGLEKTGGTVASSRPAEAGKTVASSGPRDAGSHVDSARPKTIFLFHSCPILNCLG
jgi:hypothetical protein